MSLDGKEKIVLSEIVQQFIKNAAPVSSASIAQKNKVSMSPATVRYSDNSRYLAISRIVTGEVMAATFSEWRRPGSSCSGGLVWFLRDLWPGAGWGVIDAYGRPKAAYYYLKRALAPIAVLIVDEGLNGLHVHVLNESRKPLNGRLEVRLFRDENVHMQATRWRKSTSRVEARRPSMSTLCSVRSSILLTPTGSGPRITTSWLPGSYPTVPSMRSARGVVG